MICAASVANGIAAWPGPPASATTACVAVPVAASLRRIASVTVPGIAPVGSSGTVRWAQPKAGAPAHGGEGDRAGRRRGRAAAPSTQREATLAASAILRPRRRIHEDLTPSLGGRHGRARPAGIARTIVCAMSTIASRSTRPAPRRRSAPTATRSAAATCCSAPGRSRSIPTRGELVCVSVARPGAALPGEPRGGVRGGRDHARAAPCGSPSTWSS